MEKIILLFLNLIFFSQCFVLDLGGKWNLSNANKTINIVGTVPGDIYTDLNANGVIGNFL